VTEQQRTTSIDQAALLVALLAVFFQVTDEPGPWGPVNLVFGAVLLLMIAAYAQPSLHRRVGPVYLQVLAVAVGAALGLCLLIAWPAQETVVKAIALARGASVAGDDLGDDTTNFVFPIVLLLGSWSIYQFTVRRLMRAHGGPEVAAGSAAPDQSPGPRRGE
jgi:hypothetical protein